METKRFTDVYQKEPIPHFEMTIDCGPMSISHWGMHDLGRFGVYYLNGKAYWQEDGETFIVVPA